MFLQGSEIFKNTSIRYIPMKRGITFLIVFLFSLPLAFSALAPGCYTNDAYANLAFREDCSGTSGCGMVDQNPVLNQCGSFCGDNAPVTNRCGNSCENADFTMDGSINSADQNLLSNAILNGYQATGSNAILDLNMDGSITVLDLSLFSQCSGSGYSTKVQAYSTLNQDGANGLYVSTYDKTTCHPSQCVYLYTCYNEGAALPARLVSGTSSPNECATCDTICDAGQWKFCRANNDVRGGQSGAWPAPAAPGTIVQGKLCAWGGQWRTVLKGPPYVGAAGLPCEQGYCPAGYRCSTETPAGQVTSAVGVCCQIGWYFDQFEGKCTQYENDPGCSSACDKPTKDLLRPSQLGQCVQQLLQADSKYSLCRKQLGEDGTAFFKLTSKIIILNKQ